MKDLVKRLKRNPYLRHACGYRDKASIITEMVGNWVDEFL